jgi:hypothetical protein
MVTPRVRRMLAAAAVTLAVALVLFCSGHALIAPILATVSGLCCVLALDAFDLDVERERRRRRGNGPHR